MLRYLRYLVLAIIAIGLLVVSLANRGAVTVTMLPGDLGALLGVNWSIEMPLFVVMFGGIVAGVLIGFVWEWVREHKFRATASTKTREVERLERELANIKSAKSDPVTEALALVDGPRKAG